MFNNLRDTKDIIESETLNFLRQKYGKDFNVINCSPAGMDVPYDELLCSCPEDPEKIFKAYREKRNQKIEISDSYYCLIVNDFWLKECETIMYREFKPCKVLAKITNGVCDNSLIYSSQMYDAFRDKKLTSAIRVFIDDNYVNELTEKSERVFKLLASKCIKTICTISVCKGFNILDITENNFKNYLSDKSKIIKEISRVI